MVIGGFGTALWTLIWQVTVPVGSGLLGAELMRHRFRIFNPVTQSKKFDPDGDYIRQYVPELTNMPSKYIHEPWLAPQDILDSAGVILGSDYPYPVVDIKQSRERALAAFKQTSNDGNVASQ